VLDARDLRALARVNGFVYLSSGRGMIVVPTLIA
jgi:hypothetical protein